MKLGNMSFESLAELYWNRFPKISYKTHLRIIESALYEDDSVWDQEGFMEWYDEAGEGLQERGDVLNDILESVDYHLYRESMILNGNWDGESILERLASHNIPADAIVEHKIGNGREKFYYGFN